MENILKLVLGFIIIIFIAVLGYQVYAQASSDTYVKLTNDLAEVQAGNQSIEETNRLLRIRINALRTDPRAIERKVRDELGMARPGEVVILLKHPKETFENKNKDED